MLELRRIYDDPTSERPRVTGVTILRAEVGAPHRFAPKLLDRGLAEGWLAMDRATINIRGTNGDAEYRILLAPGHYCSHCGGPLDDSTHGALHVAVEHASAPSPDPNNPSGWRRAHYYATVCEKAPDPPPPTTGLSESTHKQTGRHIPAGEEV